ncbi:MAG: dienelactone hydrolase family protein [Saprospiraceae bacterium]|nr:dienelactone hydrolase family protein [Saprospiraceae bacterium]
MKTKGNSGLVILLLLALLSSSCRISKGFTDGPAGEFIARSYQHGEMNMPYRILYPVVKKSKYPLLIFMHGSGERGSDNERQLIHSRQMFLENMQAFPAVVVLPQCPTNDYWSSVDITTDGEGKRFHTFNDKKATPAMETVLSLIDSLSNLPFIDKDRIYATGLSMGGMATYEIMWRRPGLLAAAAPICGGAYEGKVGEMSKTPCIRIFHGADDDVIDVNHSRSIYKLLKNLSANVQYTEYAGVKHNSWAPAYKEADFFTWMFSCKKE